MKHIFAVFLVLTLCCFIGGCATSPVAEQEPPPPKAVYNFQFTPPEKAVKKLGVTIGIVSPKWDDKISARGEQGKTQLLDVGINPNPTELLRYPSLVAHLGPTPRELYEIAQDFTKATSHDFEGIILARGFDTMGPFRNVEDMTYPQKTACSLIIVPEFSQIIRSRPTTVMTDVIEGTAVIRTEIVLNIYEPLSKEKLWSKRFTNESQPFAYKVKYSKSYVYDKNRNNRIGVQRQGITWDNRTNGFAQGFTGLFQDLMKKSWAYLSPEEIMVLKKHSDDIREKKRF
ncbi:MAG TPA: hypothetical protein PLR60_07650 [Syntrophorhabdaceae bacterium]|nr:hypothetical protein [Syntrophorhabdaceae bacterium]